MDHFHNCNFTGITDFNTSVRRPYIGALVEFANAADEVELVRYLGKAIE